MTTRQPDALAEGTFDLLVIGGGITGAGVALDARLRGLRVGLVEKGDFASGTSSISSKLVHGGLRYLEHGDFRLVYEALHERARLLRNAPHLAWPLRFLLPFYRGARVPAWKWRAGLMLYDVLAGSGNIRRSRPVPTRTLLGEVPGLRADGLLGGAEYHDAQMDDARLCVEVVLTAASQGAVVANYVEVVGFEQTSGRIDAVRAIDRVSGRELRIRTRQVVNATGPWGDAIRKLAGDDAGPRLRPTKGVHLVTARRNLPGGFLLLHPADGRVFFVLPWLGKTLIGTTDTVCDDLPDHLAITQEDVGYLLAGFNHYFAPSLAESDLMGRFVGVRPLVRSRPGQPSAISREFALTPSPSGLLTVSGGKYTTYREMAEVITDAVVKRLGLRRLCRTRDFPLDGAPREPWEEFVRVKTADLSRKYGLDDAAARHLTRRYGSRAEAVAGYVAADSSLHARVVPSEPDLLAELAYQRDREMAVRPEDCLLRRTRLGLFHPNLLAAPSVSSRQSR